MEAGKVIVEAFLRWTETAKAGDRARAANALGRAYLGTTMPAAERDAAEMAMTFLLDDPSPRVRLSLAEALAHAADAPRNVILSLATDQPEIAAQVILCSPLFNDADLVDLASRGDSVTRVLIASRGALGASVVAAIAEIGDEEEVLCLLENDGACWSRASLKRVTDRLGHSADIRRLLLERHDLPCDARHLLMQQVSDALAEFSLVQATLSPRRLQHVTREAGEAATVAIAGAVNHDEISGMVEHLRLSGRLTPAFLMHTLCSGKVDFFAGAVANLSGCSEPRVRSILGTGRMHAVRALFEAAGLSRDISTLFVEATMLWRQASRSTMETMLDTVSQRLLRRLGRRHGTAGGVTDLLVMVEKLHIQEQRQSARNFVSQAMPYAA
ncbi:MULTISPECIES: DUF2336 domain-containing protein [unclassified Rhizobium]|uniref:DUF2336 domain-containing protein n=1 Tax=unclassified Rhizobium TaxID=2613769 RepID=UPI001ADD1E2B|nr:MULTISPECIES: DUF2336 domain-containing protein [unclassified Rhizobium]MBO9098447.1 DUF2336 domain-containing protein [Rhizobium sp. L58/93]MBO9168713.1 DUF2336 domain-containing protein [Rhizobium sp. L245/93]MBO9184663.1 DUF2336 domain-containing protein [Rhizobium sp. E27B/91]MBO9132749.1 DUF2336 domain-containing protein [Rhizobium sp. B209b/85]QXZ85770.1 DUF2336 domain-containing protein [Rhizobium sp. K1/93]